MARSDYRLCDVCGEKAFYDANLNYEWPDKNGNNSWGKKIETADLVHNADYSLDYVGDWVVLCRECKKTHRIAIEVVIPDSAD